MELYDAHIHFLWDGPFEKAALAWGDLRENGLRGVALIVMAHHLADRRRCLDLGPHLLPR